MFTHAGADAPPCPGRSDAAVARALVREVSGGRPGGRRQPLGSKIFWLMILRLAFASRASPAASRGRRRYNKLTELRSRFLQGTDPARQTDRCRASSAQDLRTPAGAPSTVAVAWQKKPSPFSCRPPPPPDGLLLRNEIYDAAREDVCRGAPLFLQYADAALVASSSSVELNTESGFKPSRLDQATMDRVLLKKHHYET